MREVIMAVCPTCGAIPAALVEDSVPVLEADEFMKNARASGFRVESTMSSVRVSECKCEVVRVKPSEEGEE